MCVVQEGFWMPVPAGEKGRPLAEEEESELSLVEMGPFIRLTGAHVDGRYSRTDVSDPGTIG